MYSRMKSHEDIATHETRDVSIKPVALGVGALLLCILLLHFALAGLQFGFKKQTQREDRRLGGSVAEPGLAASRVRFPGPKLQVTPRVDLQAFRAREEARLNSYGWVDKTAGVVRIPIARAMDLLIQRGLPVRGTNETPRQISDLELIQKRAEGK
jgi:hypothetical protein